MNEIIKFKGRNYSGYKNVNFLYSDNNIFFMDNHRASLWCYLQIMKNKTISEINYYHIDEHTDTLYANHEKRMHNLPASFLSISIDDYLKCTWGDKYNPIPIFDWQTWGSIFLDFFKKDISLCCFATHGEGDKPQHKNLVEISSQSLIDDLQHKLNAHDNWWVNVDLDYFFIRSDDQVYVERFTDEYVHAIFEIIKQGLKDESISCLTVCLSPECCGGWDNAESMAYKMAIILEIPFILSECS